MKQISRFLQLYGPLALATAICMTVVLFFIDGAGAGFHPEPPKVLTALLLAVVVVAFVGVLLNPLRRAAPEQDRGDLSAYAFESSEQLPN